MVVLEESSWTFQNRKGRPSRGACEAEDGDKNKKTEESAAMLCEDGLRHSGGLNVNLSTCSQWQCLC